MNNIFWIKIEDIMYPGYYCMARINEKGKFKDSKGPKCNLMFISKSAIKDFKKYYSYDPDLRFLLIPDIVERKKEEDNEEV